MISGELCGHIEISVKDERSYGSGKAKVNSEVLWERYMHRIKVSISFD